MADSETTVGRETVQIVEIKQPFCEHTFGSAPCTASAADNFKCYNTRFTCQDPSNFSRGTPLSLYFSRGRVAERNIPGVPYVLPFLLNVSTSPAKLNIAGANPDIQGLGMRALVSITFQDSQHTDRVVDPYLSGRSWDAMNETRGSFWSRWAARNRYRQNIELVVYEGYEGQTLAQMVKRTYFLTSFTGPDVGGRVQIQGKDILARIEERKAQAPAASPGVLYTNIDYFGDTFLVASAVEDDYPASGTLRIDNEIMIYTARSASGDNLRFSGVRRGTDGTTPAAHAVDAQVQHCVRYEDQSADDVLSDLLTTYGKIDASWIDTPNWAAEATDFMWFMRLTTLITEPRSVAQLVSGIQVQTGCNIWWDERAALVKFKSIRGQDTEPDLLEDTKHILAGSFGVKELPRERISQVWVYYNCTDFTANPQAATSYLTAYIHADLDSEDDDEYGEASIKKIYGQWISTESQAKSLARRIGRMYRDNPLSATFRMDAKDRGYWIGDVVRISHPRLTTIYGERDIQYWQIISAEEVVPGEVVQYEARNTALAFTYSRIMANGSPDYSGGGAGDKLYIGDNDGLLSDGEPAGRIG